MKLQWSKVFDNSLFYTRCKSFRCFLFLINTAIPTVITEALWLITLYIMFSVVNGRLLTFLSTCAE